MELSAVVYYLFWISAIVLFYCYFGYALIVSIIYALTMPARQVITNPETTEEWPAVTLLVCAYNEKEVLKKKIENILELDYPAEKLSVIFITDGTTDDSDRLIRQYPLFKLLHQPGRLGKYAAVKKGMQNVATPLVVFSDANSILNRESIKNIVVHYANGLVGGVAGEKRIFKGKEISAVGEAEGFYWQYESYLKKLDARFNTVVGAAGELFSIRSGLFLPLEEDIILDDFIISMNICLKGYKIEYEPGAFATEYPSASIKQEMKRKIRISAGAYQSIRLLGGSFNFFRHPLLIFQYVSRRLFRWVICPLMLPVFFLTNLYIFISNTHLALYDWVFYGQVIFYLLVLPGWWLVSKRKRSGILVVPFYFIFMNYCLVAGFFRILRKKQSMLWEKSSRQVVG